MRWHSGLFLVIALAIACRIIVLPALDGETIRPRWPLPIGQTRSMIRVVMIVGSVSRRSRSCGYSGTSLVNSGRALGLLRVQPVDLVQADQRVELLAALALARLPDRALDDVALAQPVPADLGQRDVHVVGAGQVAGGADEPVVVQHVQDAGDRDEDVVLADHGLGLAAAAALAAPVVAAAGVPVAEPVPAAAAARTAVPVVVAAAVAVVAGALVPAALLVAVAAALVDPGGRGRRSRRPGRPAAAVAATRLPSRPCSEPSLAARGWSSRLPSSRRPLRRRRSPR